MKLAVCTNFVFPLHVGGAEKVVNQITTSMLEDYNFDCTIFAGFGRSKIIHNNINIIPISNISDETFVKNLVDNNFDHILIYSDHFIKLSSIINNLHIIKNPITMIPVGFNRIRDEAKKKSKLHDDFKNNQDKFKIVLHSDNYFDSVYCRENNLPFSIIPNGVDLHELAETELNFRQIYNINTKHLIVCVSNFFEGKGQEYLIEMVRGLTQKRNDFTLVLISSTIAYVPGNVKREKLRKYSEELNLPILFLKDISREQVIQAIHACDFFVLPSQQEVAPLVILESMACKKPWIAANVGNVKDLHGGICHEGVCGVDKKIIFDDELKYKFMDSINFLLDNPNACNYLGRSGYQQIIDSYNWDVIKTQYYNHFTKIQENT